MKSRENLLNFIKILNLFMFIGHPGFLFCECSLEFFAHFTLEYSVLMLNCRNAYYLYIIFAVYMHYIKFWVCALSFTFTMNYFSIQQFFTLFKILKFIIFPLWFVFFVYCSKTLYLLLRNTDILIFCLKILWSFACSFYYSWNN